MVTGPGYQRITAERARDDQVYQLQQELDAVNAERIDLCKAIGAAISHLKNGNYGHAMAALQKVML